jgi:hypothetical protein
MPDRRSWIDNAKVIELIWVQSVFGKGVDGDPVRAVDEYYTLDGVLVARVDSWEGEEDEQEGR